MTMRSFRALAAAAAFATATSAASAQAIAFAVDGALQGPGSTLPTLTDGQTLQIDVVLDATTYAGDFYAWHQYGFNITFETTGAPIDPSQITGNLAETDFLETADSTGVAAIGNPWTGGRRPGAFPGSTSNNGGTRFGSFLGDDVSSGGITTSLGPGLSIQGRQQSIADPENNALINQGLVFEVYRFNFTYSAANGQLRFGLEDVVLNLYPLFGSVFNEFVDPAFIGDLDYIPSPAPLTLMALALPVAARRRR